MFKFLVTVTLFLSVNALDKQKDLTRNGRAPVQVYRTGPEIAILRQEQEVGENGNYRWAYETANGIAAEEQGSFRPLGPEEGILQVQGRFEYSAPEGDRVSLQYIADENGFQPQGSHLPTPPPIPDYILRSLQWNAAHPEEERQYNYN